MRALIISDHAYMSHRKAAIHFLARELVSSGIEVAFVSCGISAFSVLRGDYRFGIRNRYGRDVIAPDGVRAMTPILVLHPQNVHVESLNQILSHSFYGGFAGKFVQKSLSDMSDPDFIIMESGYPVVLFEELRARFPKSKLVYWVNDDPRTIRLHPIVLSADRVASQEADLVVTVAPLLAARYPRSVLIPHGIDLEAFSKAVTNPYSGSETKVVSVGTMLFDRQSVLEAAVALPEFQFHMIGPRKERGNPKNVYFYGEMRFEDTIPFIRHADIGLAPYKKTPGVDYIASSSMKIMQYRHCEKVVVAPDFACGGRQGFSEYIASDVSSLVSALRRAKDMKSVPAPKDDLSSWRAVAEEFRRHI